MANSLYDFGRNEFLTGGIDWVTDSITADLIDTSLYTVNLSTDQYHSVIPSGAIIASSALSGKTANAGVADANDPAFNAVPSGNTVSAIVLYKVAATDATSPLIAYIDTATGLPITTSGGNIVIQFSSGTDRIFKL